MPAWERLVRGVQLKDLRLLLRSAAHSEDGAALFRWLYRSWCHSLGAVLSLCFLSEVSASPAEPRVCQAYFACVHNSGPFHTLLQFTLRRSPGIFEQCGASKLTYCAQ